MSKKILWLIGLSLVAMFLMSCGLAQLASKGQVTEAAVVPTDEVPTFTPTLKPASTPTLVPATNTPAPPTPLPTHTPTKTPIPPTNTPSPMPAPTLSADFEKFQELLQEADSLYQAGNFEGAAALYNQILTLDLARDSIIDTYILRMAELRGEVPEPTPTHIPTITAANYYQQGKDFFDKQQWGAAVEAFTKAIALAPQAADYYGARGLAYLNNSNFELALADFNQAITLDPEKPGPYFFRGHYYFFKGETDRAIADLERAKALGLPSEVQPTVDEMLEQLKSSPQGQPGFEVPPGKALFVFANYTDIDWNIDVGPHHLEVAGWQGGEYPVVQVILDPGTYTWQGHSPGGGYYIADAHGNIGFKFTIAAGEAYQASAGGPPR